jgi:hypothetical protein
MRRFILLLAIAVLGVATASADPLCVASTISTGSPGCSVGELTFSNWVVTPAGVGSPSSVSLVQVTQPTPYTTWLWFNPGLQTNQDLWLSFTVTGPLTGIDLMVGGTEFASVTERACSSPLVGNICPEGTQLAAIEAGAGASDSAQFAGVSQTTYIFKNIGAYGDRELSSVVESFETVPEPLTFGLIGSGLVVLGLLRRRAR